MKLPVSICFCITIIAGNRIGLLNRLGLHIGLELCDCLYDLELCDLNCMRNYSGRAGTRQVTNKKQFSKLTMSPYKVREFMGAGVLLYSKHLN